MLKKNMGTAAYSSNPALGRETVRSKSSLTILAVTMSFWRGERPYLKSKAVSSRGRYLLFDPGF